MRHNDQSDELDDVKDYSEEEINHQRNDESSAHNTHHKSSNDNGVNELLAQACKNGTKATKNSKVDGRGTGSKKPKQRCSNVINDVHKSGQPSCNNTAKTSQTNAPDFVKFEN